MQRPTHTNPQFSQNLLMANNQGVGAFVKSPQNLQHISAQVYGLAKQYHGIELDERFKGTLLSTVDTAIKQFGHKTIGISDQQHLENLNKIIIDDCLRYVQQYRSTMGNNSNPFADLSDQKLDSDNLSKAVDDLAAARGYNFQPRDNISSPRLDFAEPAQERRLTTEELTKKLEVERGLFATSQAGINGPALHEMLGTSKPNDPYYQNQQGHNPYPGNPSHPGNPGNLANQGNQGRSDPQRWSPNYNSSNEDNERAQNNNNDPRDEYTRRLNMIKERGQQGLQVQLDGQQMGNHQGEQETRNQNRRGNDLLPIDLPKGHSSLNNNNYNSYNNSQEPQSLLAKSGLLRNSGNLVQNQGLSLDLRQSLEAKTSEGSYILRFHTIENVKGIQLNSFICPNYKILELEPNLGLRLSNLPSRYANANIFSKMNLINAVNRYNHYKPSEPDPLYLYPSSDKPANLNYFEFSLRTWDDQAINLDFIDVQQILKNMKSGTMKILCREPHYLLVGDPISLTVVRTSKNDKSAIGQRLEVLKICDENTFITALPATMEGEITVTRIYPRVTLNLTVLI